MRREITLLSRLILPSRVTEKSASDPASFHFIPIVRYSLTEILAQSRVDLSTDCRLWHIIYRLDSISQSADTLTVLSNVLLKISHLLFEGIFRYSVKPYSIVYSAWWSLFCYSKNYGNKIR